MHSIRRTSLVALLTLGLLLAVQAPTSAVFARSVFASEAFNFVEACPDYVSFEVARYAEHDQAGGYEPPVDTTVTIQAITPPLTGSSPAGDFVLNQPVPLRAFDPPLSIELPDEGIWEEFSHHGRAVLAWNHRLAPGIQVAIGAAESFQSPPASQPHTLTISTRCSTPKLELVPVCASPTAATLEWRVRNRNPFPVDYNAEVQGVRELRLGTVPAKSAITFTSDRVDGTNTVHLYVGGRRWTPTQPASSSREVHLTPLRGSGAATPQGALRAIDPCGAAAFLADLRSAPPAAASHVCLGDHSQWHGRLAAGSPGRPHGGCACLCPSA